MEKTTNTGSTTATLDRTTRQPRPLFLALVLTSLLYFGVKQPIANPNVTNGASQTTKTLSDSVTSAVVQDLSARSGLPKTQLKIVEAKKQTWFDRCLGVSESNLFCSETLVPGWEITVANGEKRWIYRTNVSGSVIKLHESTNAPSKKSPKVTIA